MKTTTFCILITVAIGLWGCAPGSDQAAKAANIKPNAGAQTTTSTADPNSKNPADQPMAAHGENVPSNTPTVHSPAETQPGGAYRITPANPNDAKYKPDPKLGGG